MVLQHETMLNRNTVGGPVFTLDNQFVGMNIAAVNRVEAFAIPGQELSELVAELRKELLEKLGNAERLATFVGIGAS